MTANPSNPASVIRQRQQSREARLRYRILHHDQIIAAQREKRANSRATPHTPNFNYAHRGKNKKVKMCLYLDCGKVAAPESDYCCREHCIAEMNRAYCGGRKAQP